jgi:hypothetical protein
MTMQMKHLASLASLSTACLIAPAYAGGHMEYGYWVVTSDERQAAFYACVDNAPKISGSTDDEVFASLRVNLASQIACQAKLKNPKVDFHGNDDLDEAMRAFQAVRK